MHRRHPHREPARPARRQPVPPFAGVALAGTVAIAVLSAGVYLWAPFSDLTAQDLVAAPCAAGSTPSASAPITTVARCDIPEL